ncbi:helix-turn-helix domain-containing protein [Enterococcus mundtii]|uniref:Helix-turn-helix transcriptional regulator n=1 Tax=Enterococcus mundtii TaxID=53346 RepID=A0A848MX97_ENTMU|nr:helix-turn-helix transcriptional regulator [Enterococcus mundtii]NMP58575.1 helix-turn-helix transcriptional regulator [Enterococcus mundtii]
MTLYERIYELSKKQGISVFDLADRLDLSRNSIYSWKKSSPKAETLQKVADYFDVSVDYLLGRTDTPSPVGNDHKLNRDDLTLKDADEEDLLAAFRLESEDMTEEEKKKFNSSLKGMMKIAKGLLNDDSKWMNR